MKTTITVLVPRFDHRARASAGDMHEWIEERPRIACEIDGDPERTFLDSNANEARIEFRFKHRVDADDFLALAVPPLIRWTRA